MPRFVLIVLLCLGAPQALHANDGYGGLTATGLQLQATSQIRMVSEDLFLSPERIRVKAVFQNEHAEEVRGQVIFPLAPISLAEMVETSFAIPPERLAKEDVVGFTALVNGTPVKVQTDRIAVRSRSFEEQRSLAAQFEDPGEEVTGQLKALSIPLTMDIDKVVKLLGRLPQTAKDQLERLDLAEFYPDSPPVPNWSIVVRYHWPQRFAAGSAVTIEHSYTPSPPGGIFVWPKPGEPLDSYHQELINTYCIDPTTRKALGKMIHPSSGKQSAPGAGNAVLLDYVLTTANSWHGPIGAFRLTIDKGKPGNILSLCIDGIRKIGPTTFVVEKKDFKPTQDLRLLIVSGMPR